VSLKANHEAILNIFHPQAQVREMLKNLIRMLGHCALSKEARTLR